MTYTSPTWVDVPPGQAPPAGAPALDSAHLQPLTDAVAALSAGGGGFTIVGPKTANYTAQPGEFVLWDTTSASKVMTLPTSPADKTVVGAKLVILGTGNTVTINCAGSDVFNKTGGGTSLTLSLLDQAFQLEYVHSTGVWVVTGIDLTLSSLNATYAPKGASRTATLVVAASNASSFMKAVADYVCTGTSTTGGDEAQINAAIIMLALSGGGKVVLSEGNFYRTAPVIGDKSNIIVEGMGAGTIVGPATNATGAANIVVGSTSASSIPQNVELRDFFVQDGSGSSTNASTGGSQHGMIFRCNNGRMRNLRTTHQALDGVRVEGFKTYGTSTTLNGAISTTPGQATQETWTVAASASFTVNGFAQVGAVSDLTGDPDPEWVLIVSKPDSTHVAVQRGYGGSTIKTHLTGAALTPFTTTNTYDFGFDDGYLIFAGRSGFYSDPWVTDSELRMVKVDGGDDISHRRTVNGFYITGSGIKLLLCHPYFCSNAGAFVNGSGLGTQTTVTIDGGDYESNGTYGVQLLWARSSTVNTYFHDNGGQNVGLASSTGIVISGIGYNSTNLTQHIYADGCSRITTRDYITWDSSTLVQTIKFVNGCTRMRVTGCHLSPILDANYAKQINLGDATYSEVDHNILEGSVWELTGADYNKIHGNVMYPLNPAPSGGGEQPTIHVVGAHTVARDNTGVTDPIATKDPRIPTNVYGESYPRSLGGTNTAGWLVTGRAHVVAIPLTAGDVISSLAFVSGTTALASGTHQWMALLDGSLNKLAVTSDDTSTAWAANTLKGLSLTAPYTVPTTGIYYAALIVTATTMPSTLASPTGQSLFTGWAPMQCGYSTAGLTDPASCPTTFAALTALPGVSYAQAR